MKKYLQLNDIKSIAAGKNLFGSVGSFSEGNVKQQKSYNQKSAGNLSSIKYIDKSHFSSTSSILPDAAKNNIPNKTSLVKTNSPSNEETSTKLGVINATPNQPADKLLNKDEEALSHGIENNLLTNDQSSITLEDFQWFTQL